MDFYAGEKIDTNFSEGGNIQVRILSGSDVIFRKTVFPTDPSISFVFPTTRNFTIEYSINSSNASYFPVVIDTICTPAPPPGLTNISPLSGPTTGGTPVTLTGTGFTDATAVTFGGVTATGVTVVNDTTITATTPAYAAGPVNVVVEAPSGNSAPVQFTYQNPPQLSISDVSLPEGDAGTTNFMFTVSLDQPAPSGGVTFDIATADGTAIAGSDYVALNVTSQTIPAGAFAHVFIVTVNGDEEFEPNETFFVDITNVVGATIENSRATMTILNDDRRPPAVSVVTPNIGPVTGGTQVHIRGILMIGATGVTFGGVAATDFMVLDDDAIAATTPAHEAGTVDVAVTTPSGTGIGYAAFTYQAPPEVSIADVSMSEGDSGTTEFTFTLSLDGPAPSGGVTFDIATADGTAVAGSDYVAQSLTSRTIPAGAVSTPFTVAVNGDTEFEPDETFFVNISNVVGATVSRGQATATINNDDLAPPTLSGVSPAVGPASGGTRVTLSGTAFTGATAVTFGGVAATDITVVDDATITATTPAHAAGSTTVQVTTPGGNASLLNGFEYLAQPTLSLTVSNDNPTFGEPVTFTATLVGGVSPTGTVMFVGSQGGNLGSAPVNATDGTAQFTTSALGAGQHNVTATYGGDANNDAAGPTAVGVTVGKIATTITLTTSHNPSIHGEEVTFTATVSPVPTSGQTEIYFGNGLGTSQLALDGAGVGIVRRSDLPVGYDTDVFVVFLGNGEQQEAQSNTIIQTVQRIPTTLALTANPAVVTLHEPVTFTAVVSPPPPQPVAVSFMIPGSFLGQSVPDASGTATLTVTTLPVGSHTITASYLGDYEYEQSSGTVDVVVNGIATTVSLASSRNPSNAGENVTFTATVTPASAAGNLVFTIDGADQPPASLAGGVARFTTSLLGPGDHQIVAHYHGDASHLASISGPLTQNVRALGSVVIRQETDGMDAIFGFSSPTPALNLSVSTSGGRGESIAASLPAGTYMITADDMTGAGFGLTGLVCSDGDSTADVAGRTASIMLDAGEAVVCTFTSVNSREKTTQLIEDFLTTRAGLILANQPDIQRRIDRLNGVVSSGGSPVSSLIAYLPGIAEGSPLSVSTSLGAINRLAGNEQPGRFDVWFEGTFALFDRDGPNGSFNTASLGADYLVTSDLLIGAFAQMDHLSQRSSIDPATISGTGWLAGPYATARIGQNLYFDVLAAFGTSSNKVSPYGTYEDGFGATRWLFSASLQGQWQWDNWTFSPRARASYFQETTKAYTDSLGVNISPISAGLGQIAVGPAISYRHNTEGNMVIDTGLRFEGVADILNNSTRSGFDKLHGRIEGTLDISLRGGASLGLSAAYDGIGSDMSTTSAKIRINLPLN